MDNQLENKLSMYEKVQAMLTLRATDTAPVAMVTTVKNDFSTIVTKILQSAAITNTDITGYTVLKQNKRNELTKILLKVSASHTAWASVNAKPQEAEKTDLTPAMVNTLRDNDLYTYAAQVYTIANAQATALAPYALTPAEIALLNTRNAEFLAVIQEPRVRINERSAEFENLNRLFAQADDLLTTKLDPLMRIFQQGNPTLYDAYTNARGIDGTGAYIAPDYRGTVLANSIHLVADIPYLASRTYIVKNRGAIEIQCCLSTSATAMQSPVVIIAPNATIQRLSSNMQANASFLLLQNTDTAQVADYEVWIEE